MNENGKDKINKIKEMKRRSHNGTVTVLGCASARSGTDCWCRGQETVTLLRRAVEYENHGLAKGLMLHV